VRCSCEVSHREDTRVRDQTAETIGLRADPVRHVPAERSTHSHDLRWRNVGPFFESVSHAHEILVALVAPYVAPNALDELLAETCRASWIRESHRVTLRDGQQRIPAPVPLVGTHVYRPAVDPQKRRKASDCTFWFHEEELDRNSIGRGNTSVFDF